MMFIVAMMLLTGSDIDYYNIVIAQIITNRTKIEKYFLTRCTVDGYNFLN